MTRQLLPQTQQERDRARQDEGDRVARMLAGLRPLTCQASRGGLLGVCGASPAKQSGQGPRCCECWPAAIE